MSDYKPIGDIPAFKQMREQLARLRDETVKPLRDQLRETVKLLEVERQRLKDASIAPSTGSTGSGVSSAPTDRETGV